MFKPGESWYSGAHIDGRLFRMKQLNQKRQIGAIGLFGVLVLVLLPAAVFAQGSVRHCSGLITESQKYAEFQVTTYRSQEGDSACLDIRQNGKMVYSHSDDEVVKFVIGNDINRGLGSEKEEGDYHPPAIPIGTDITGLGVPNLIVSTWSGGAHCCFAFEVFELGPRVRLVATIDAEHSDYARFEDVNHDGKYEFVGWDYAFAYWHTSFNNSPAPRIVLRFDGTKYVLATDLMRKPAPSAGELRKTVDEIRDDDWQQNYPPPQLWGAMLDLIYTGNPDAAWKFASDAWVPGHVSKQRFLQGFCGRLANSQYFEQLKPTITNAPCEFDPKNGGGK